MKNLTEEALCSSEQNPLTLSNPQAQFAGQLLRNTTLYHHKNRFCIILNTFSTIPFPPNLQYTQLFLQIPGKASWTPTFASHSFRSINLHILSERVITLLHSSFLNVYLGLKFHLFFWTLLAFNLLHRSLGLWWWWFEAFKVDGYEWKYCFSVMAIYICGLHC